MAIFHFKIISWTKGLSLQFHFQCCTQLILPFHSWCSKQRLCNLCWFIFITTFSWYAGSSVFGHGLSMSRPSPSGLAAGAPLGRSVDPALVPTRARRLRASARALSPLWTGLATGISATATMTSPPLCTTVSSPRPSPMPGLRSSPGRLHPVSLRTCRPPPPGARNSRPGPRRQAWKWLRSFSSRILRTSPPTR